MVEQVLVEPHIAGRSDARGKCGEVRRIHASRIQEDWAPPVPGAIETNDFIHLVHSVNLEVAEQAQGLQQDSDVFQLAAALQVQRVLRATLEGVHHKFHLANRDRKKRHVADAEAAALNDLHPLPVGAGIYRPELPRVTHTTRIVHGLKHPENQCPWGRHRALVHEPAGNTWTREVFAARHDEDFVGAHLDTSPSIFDCERTVAQDRNVVAREAFVRSVIVHAVTNVSIKSLLPGIVNYPVFRHATRVAIQHRTRHDTRLS
mmetsp:Transcript_97290/g.253710  ORF Transcript_97290/g.253710 Transcript_97290/m.253710 type:complete len:261 (+) Transcript_97290:470-1252(+)